MSPDILWRPSATRIAEANLTAFTEDARRVSGRPLQTYAQLHQWSVEESEAFWTLVAHHCQVRLSGDLLPAREGTAMPGARFFPRATMSFAENLLAYAEDTPQAVALCAVGETRPRRQMTFGELRQKVAALATRLRGLGVQPFDRVAGFLPNIEEAVIAMLATASLGATWSSCSTDFGTAGVLDRFGQISPKVLFAVDGYRYGGKSFDCLPRVREIASRLEGLEQVVVISYDPNHPTANRGEVPFTLDIVSDKPTPGVWRWNDLLHVDAPELLLPQFPFDHPLYVMYSSGTTGLPKCILHGAGGTLLQHKKELCLHLDVRPGDRVFYFTTCGWMMWNWLVSALSIGAQIVLYDGSPTWPGVERLYQLIEDEGITHFGTSPKFIGACRGRVEPQQVANLESMRVMMSTGAPLLPEDFDWVYQHVKPDLHLASISGGTDIISCFMLGVPTLPVVRGEIQAAGLGMDIAAYDEHGQSVVRQKGELVCRTPFPSAPVGFWNDPSRTRYQETYFKRGDGVWYHGDYIEVTESQGPGTGIVVFGRSDATLNPGGVRIGTAEIYRLVETHPAVRDSIVVGVPAGGDVEVVLFVKLEPSARFTDELMAELVQRIRSGATPRHVPARIHPIEDVPYTISGKKVELAVTQILQGEEPKNRSALQNPECLDAYRAYARVQR